MYLFSKTTTIYTVLISGILVVGAQRGNTQHDSSRNPQPSQGTLERIILESMQPQPITHAGNTQHSDYAPDTQYHQQNGQHYAGQSLDDYLDKTENVIEVDYLGASQDSITLGMYDPVSDTIYVLRSLDPEKKLYVLRHEQEHRRRAYTGESQQEELVDKAVMSKYGYPHLPVQNAGYRRAA